MAISDKLSDAYTEMLFLDEMDKLLQEYEVRAIARRILETPEQKRQARHERTRQAVMKPRT